LLLFCLLLLLRCMFQPINLRQPSNHLSNQEVLLRVQEGKAIDCPVTCPHDVFDQFLAPCFYAVPEARPSFYALTRLLHQHIGGHSSIQRQTGRRQSFDTRVQTMSSNSEAGRTVDTLYLQPNDAAPPVLQPPTGPGLPALSSERQSTLYLRPDDDSEAAEAAAAAATDASADTQSGLHTGAIAVRASPKQFFDSAPSSVSPRPGLLARQAVRHFSLTTTTTLTASPSTPSMPFVSEMGSLSPSLRSLSMDRHARRLLAGALSGGGSSSDLYRRTSPSPLHKTLSCPRELDSPRLPAVCEGPLHPAPTRFLATQPEFFRTTSDNKAPGVSTAAAAVVVAEGVALTTDTPSSKVGKLAPPSPRRFWCFGPSQ
jgi:hypothetical protein